MLRTTRNGIVFSVIGLLLILSYFVGLAPGVIFVLGLAMLLYGPVIAVWGWDRARKARRSTGG